MPYKLDCNSEKTKFHSIVNNELSQEIILNNQK